MIRLFLLTFLANIPFQNLHIFDNDIAFNNDLHNILCSVGTLGYLLPKFMKNNEICNTDDDCPLIMRCCEVGLKKYCCTPNNFVQTNLAYMKEPVKTISHVSHVQKNENENFDNNRVIKTLEENKNIKDITITPVKLHSVKRL